MTRIVRPSPAVRVDDWPVASASLGYANSPVALLFAAFVHPHGALIAPRRDRRDT